jgi:DNA-binding transcriptional MerR regulator
MNQTESLYSIQQLSTKLNIPKPTLRFWEKEFEGILLPMRTPGGQRRYAPEHLFIIQKIKMLKKEGLSLMEIKTKLKKAQMPNVGYPESGNEHTDRIDLLVERVAGAVKMEVLRFFRSEEG